MAEDNSTSSTEIRQQVGRRTWLRKQFPGEFWKSAEFWKTATTVTDGECWEWLRTRSRAGYGQIRIGGVLKFTHRLVYENLIGAIPPGLCVLHNCPAGDNPACCNPEHLFLGTKAENSEDMLRKARHRIAPQPRKLDADKVKKIRLRLQAGESVASLAVEYKVGETMIRRIANRKRWRKVP